MQPSHCHRSATSTMKNRKKDEFFGCDVQWQMEQGGQSGKAGLTKPLLVSVLAALCGMFVFGFNTGVINSPENVRPRQRAAANAPLLAPC